MSDGRAQRAWAREEEVAAPRGEAQRAANHYLTGSWLFMLGCIAFTADAGLEVAQEVTVKSLLYLLGSLLFTVGCVFFLLDARRPRH